MSFYHALSVLLIRVSKLQGSCELFSQRRSDSMTTISRGRLLNRFGKDFEGIDSSLADNLGNSVENGASLAITLGAITFVGGPLFALAVAVLGVFYYHRMGLSSFYRVIS